MSGNGSFELTLVRYPLIAYVVVNQTTIRSRPQRPLIAYISTCKFSYMYIVYHMLAVIAASYMYAYEIYWNQNTWIWIWIWILVFNATFSNISAISWRPVLVVEEARLPGQNHRPGQATGKRFHLRLRVECTLFSNLQSWARTHAVLVIGLYDLLDPKT